MRQLVWVISEDGVNKFTAKRTSIPAAATAGGGSGGVTHTSPH